MTDYLLNIKLACVGLAEHFFVKLSGSILLTTAGYLIGTEHFAMMYALMILAGIDFITGLASAKFKGDEITSRKAIRSASKFVVYILFVAAAHLSEVIIPGQTYFESIVISFLTLTEFISIIENIGGMGFAVPQKLLNKLREYRDEK